MMNLLALFLAFTVNTTEPVQGVPATVISISDGDTFTAQVADKQVKVRMACIDAPEKKQAPWGSLATATLKSKIAPNDIVFLQIQNQDRYGRLVSEVFDDGKSVNLDLVRNGIVVVYHEYLQKCDKDAYVEAENAAKAEKRNFWSQARVVLPKHYRRGQR